MICCLQEINFTFKNTPRLRVKGFKKIFQATRNQKKAILTSDRNGQRTQSLPNDKGQSTKKTKQL